MLMEQLEDRRVLATITVTSAADLGGAIGEVTLREAIEQANATSEVDTIQFAPALAGQTITLDGSQIEITDSVIIEGPGADQLTIDGDGRSRILKIDDGDSDQMIDVTISGLRFANGMATRAVDEGNGGAILSRESLTVSDSVFFENQGVEEGAIGIRGGIALIDRSEFVGNFGRDSTGAIGATQSAKLTIHNSVFRANRSGGVGAVLHFGDTLAIEDSLFENNEGGALGFGTVFASANLFVRRSSFLNNSTDGTGGAIYARPGTNHTALVENSTFVGNTAGSVGAISATGNFTLQHSTIAGNQSQSQGAIGLDDSVVLSHNIIVGNTQAGVSKAVNGTANATSSYNIIDDALSAGGLVDGQQGNVVGVDWKSVIENDGTNPSTALHGGKTPSVAILGGGAAADSGLANAMSGSNGIPLTDQRGADRVNGRIDIGAFEIGPLDVDIDWQNPADIVFGTALDSTQLNATVDGVPGVFSYIPAAGTVLDAGNNQTLAVTFTPEDQTAYRQAMRQVTINVLQATPDLQWEQPEAILFGTALGAEQLNATSSVEGIFQYSPNSGTVLAVGQHELNVLFTPSTANYQEASATVMLEVLPALDFGDAPSATQSGFQQSYPTLLVDDGARHREGGPQLGSAADLEADGIPHGTADGDDTSSADDEDGVTFTTSMIASGVTTIASLLVESSDVARLDAWVDFNRDGDWQDVGEQIFTSEVLQAGTNTLAFSVPSDAVGGGSYARFRVSTAGGLSPTGLAEDGEVEDYAVEILSGSNLPAASVLAEGALRASQVGDNIQLAQAGEVLFSAPLDQLSRLMVTGGPGADQFSVVDVTTAMAQKLAVDAAGGIDSLSFIGDNTDLDLTQLPADAIQNVEHIQVSGNQSSLTLDAETVRRLSDSSNRLRVIYSAQNPLSLGSGWSAMRPEIVDGTFTHRVFQSDANVEIQNERPFHNPIRPTDSNLDNNVSPIDALVIINSLNVDGSRVLPTPSTIPDGGFLYLDSSGDGFASPLDALLIINELNRQGGGEGESRESASPLPGSTYDWSRFGWGDDERGELVELANLLAEDVYNASQAKH